MSLGNNISKARKRCGMSQEVVAEKLGKEHIYKNWANNRKIKNNKRIV